MKKIAHDTQGSAKKLELSRKTLRRLDPVDLQRAQGGRASIIRPTTDP